MSVTPDPVPGIPLWYEAFQPHLMAIAFRLGYRKEETEDLLSQFFLDLLEKGTDLSAVQNPQAYLATAFRRKLIDHNRSTKRKLFVVTNEVPDGLAEPSALESLERVQYNAELVARIKKAYLRLPPRCRSVIYLKFYEGLSTEQITLRTGLSRRSVYNNLFEGIKILRSEMRRQSPDISCASLLTLLPLLLMP